MVFAFSKHAIERIKDPGLDKETVRLTLDDPDSVVTDSKYRKGLLKNDTRNSPLLPVPTNSGRGVIQYMGFMCWIGVC